MSGFGPGAVLRLAALALCTLALLPAQLLIFRLRPLRSATIPRLYHRIVCRCLGVRTRVKGAPPPPGAGGLIVANHVSWLDISVIGAQRPLSFVAKSEVAAWPVVGLLAKLQRTVFVDRARRAATGDVAARMGQRLSAGESVVLFAEGTTGDGTRVLPMRSALLGAAHEALGRNGGEVTIWPLAVTYTGFHGMPGGRADRALLAWYGDTELAPHLKAMLAIGAIDVELAWGAPIAMGGQGPGDQASGKQISRKQATQAAQDAIRKARQEALSGRPAAS